jgi:predicted phage baseplate assembly protein
VPGSGAATTPISPADLMTAFAATAPTTILWRLRDRNGFEGSLEFAGNAGAPTNLVALVPAEDADEVVSEFAILKNSSDAVLSDSGRTSIKLSAALDNCYDRKSLTINANVALATHGETVQEVLGAGDASQPYQSFRLKQSPLTYVSASTPSGGKSTLEVRVNDVLWQELPTLYGAGPRDRVYISRRSDDGKTTVEFGDGATGARLPTGRDNVRARYRKGIGLAGLVKAGQLSQLMSRPLGVKSAVNPEDATDAKDPDSPADARRNAPLTVLTLDRTVSLLDYEDFARSFGDIAKALATWGWDGQARRVIITVAGSNGAEVKADSETMTNLIAAITNAGDPFVSFSVKSYRKATFRLQAEVKVEEPTYVRKDVLAAVDASLRDYFSFDARDFAQGVALSEIIAVMQGLGGVVGVNVTQLYRSDAPAALKPRLAAGLPSIGTDGTLLAAELLTLDPAPLEFGVLQ